MPSVGTERDVRSDGHSHLALPFNQNNDKELTRADPQRSAVYNSTLERLSRNIYHLTSPGHS